MRTVYDPKSGREVQTKYSNEEAIKRLHAVEGDFPQSLAKQHDERNRLSGCQWYHVHRILMELEKPAPPTTDADALRGLFTNAVASNLKRPQLRFKTDAGVIRVAYDRNGTLWFRCVDVRLARIDPDNTFERYRSCTDMQWALIELIIKYPLAMAVKFGKQMGRCCFCGIELTTPESVTAGYGPICADKWGLPWGHVDPAIAEYQQENQ